MNTPTGARQEPEGSDASTPRSRRGPYRHQTRTPCQMMYNRKLQKLMESLKGNPEKSVNTADKENIFQNASNTSGDINSPTLDDTSDMFAFEDKEEDDGNTSSLQSESLQHVQKLFTGSVLSSTMGHSLISSYMCRHHLRTQAQEDLLKLMQLHIPRENLLPRSMYAFRKRSGTSDTISLEPVYHSYCQRCCTIVWDGTTRCPNPCCAASMCIQSTPTFITVSIAEQLKTLLERTLAWKHDAYMYMHTQFANLCSPMLGPGFYSSLHWRKNIARKPGQLADIYGGQLYQALESAGGCLEDDRNISVMLNSDGVVVFHSTSLSIWPVLLMINELPYSQRYVYWTLYR